MLGLVWDICLVWDIGIVCIIGLDWVTGLVWGFVYRLGFGIFVFVAACRLGGMDLVWGLV